MWKLIFWFLFAYLIIMLPRYFKYKKSSYKEASGNGFWRTVRDKGNFGEFLTFAKLEKLDGNNKLLTNIYLPKEDGTTTEIDLVMISETGIYVFESKNYSGWIFGNEKYKYWTQSLKNKQKNKFLNPIWQNKGHIKALESILGIRDKGICKSYIVFSERCTLKKINVTSKEVKVIKRNNLMRYIKDDFDKLEKLMSEDDVKDIYSKLTTFTLVGEDIKKKHIEDIKQKKG